MEENTPKSKAFWVALLVVLAAMTILSMSHTIDNYFAESSRMVSQHLDIDEMLYPPLKVCLNNFMFWTNWTAAQEMNFTKPEVLFAMSFLTKVYAEEAFDVSQVEKSFFKKMKANNIFLLEQFYESIAIRPQNVLINLKRSPLKYDLMLENYATSPTSTPRYAICYRYSGDQIKDNIKELLKDNQIKTMPFDRIIFILLHTNLWTSKKERSWLTEKEIEKYSTLHKLPIWITYKGYHTDGMYVSTHARYVTVNVAVNHWKSNAEAPCHDNLDWIDGNTTCLEECHEKYFPDHKKRELSSKYTKKIFISEENTGIYFFDSENETYSKADRNSALFVNSTGNALINTRKSDNTQNLYNECMDSCNKEVGCRVWSYDVDDSELPYFEPENRSLMLIYPSSVKVMKEVDLQTWENFINSVGGIAGIWLGASILTFLQIIYLSWFQDNSKSIT